MVKTEIWKYTLGKDELSEVLVAKTGLQRKVLIDSRLLGSSLPLDELKKAFEQRKAEYFDINGRIFFDIKLMISECIANEQFLAAEDFKLLKRKALQLHKKQTKKKLW